MATTRSNERIRYRYGICLNDSCEKCKSKEVQEIPARKDFVCQNPECGKPLRECPPPKKGGNGKLIGIIAGVVVLLAIIGGVIAFSGGEEVKIPDAAEIEKVAVDSDSIATPPVEEAQPVPETKPVVAAPKVVAPAEVSAPTPKPAPSSGRKDLGYAVYKGTLKNGQPDGVNASLTFKSSHVIDSRDPKGRIAEAGDYVIGEFSEGHLVQGIWYGSDNQVKGSVIIGK